MHCQEARMHLSFTEPPFIPPGAEATSESPADVSRHALALSALTGGESMEGTDCLLEESPPERSTNYDNVSQAAGISEESPRAHEATCTSETPPALEMVLQGTDNTLSDPLKLISHELKIPITVVQGQFQLAERQLEQLLAQELLPLLVGRPDLEQKMESLRQRVLRGI